MSEVFLDKIGYQSKAAFSRTFKSEFKQPAGEVNRFEGKMVSQLLLVFILP